MRRPGGCIPFPSHIVLELRKKVLERSLAGNAKVSLGGVCGFWRASWIFLC